ncbi:MAG TPA: hypothetical protein VGI10_10665 [Polyangiaceae bacterium]
MLTLFIRVAKKEIDAASAPATEVAKPSTDVALVVGATPDGKGAQIVRARDGKLELGAVHPLSEGTPIHGEVVKLTPRVATPQVCDVEVLVAKPTAALPNDVATPVVSAPHKGPARVASNAYRENWDAIWSARADKSELLN